METTLLHRQGVQMQREAENSYTLLHGQLSHDHRAKDKLLEIVQLRDRDSTLVVNNLISNTAKIVEEHTKQQKQTSEFMGRQMVHPTFAVPRGRQDEAGDGSSYRSSRPLHDDSRGWARHDPVPRRQHHLDRHDRQLSRHGHCVGRREDSPAVDRRGRDSGPLEPSRIPSHTPARPRRPAPSACLEDEALPRRSRTRLGSRERRREREWRSEESTDDTGGSEETDEDLPYVPA